MSKLIRTSTGEEWDIPPDQVEAALAAVDADGVPLYRPAEGATTTIQTAGGEIAEVDIGELAGHIEQGATAETTESLRGRQRTARMEREHGGVGGAVLTGVERFTDAATFGGLSALGGAIDPTYKERYKERGEVHDIIAPVSEVAGLVVPSVLSGGTGTVGTVARATPAGLAARAGTKATAKYGAVKGLAVEGALFGAGTGMQELALSDDPLTMERAASVIGSRALFGGALGAGTGLFAKAAQKGIEKAKVIADDAAKSLSARASVGDDLAGLDKAALRAKRLSTATELGDEVVSGTKEYSKSDDLFRVTSSSEKKVLTDSRGWIRKQLDDPRGLAENPNAVMKSLRKEEEILRSTLQRQDDILARMQKADDDLVARLGDDIAGIGPGKKIKLKGEDAALYGDLTGVKVKRKGISLDKGDLEEFRELIRSGAPQRIRAKSMSQLPDALEANVRLQTQIDAIRHGTAPRLAEIQSATDALTTGAKKAGLLEQVSQGTIFSAATGLASPLGPAAPIVGAKIAQKLNDLIFGRLGKAGVEASQRTSHAIQTLMDTASKAGKLAPPLATRVLASTSFAPTVATKAKLPKATLISSYKARTAEIQSQTTMGPEGHKMTPKARQQLADRLSGVRAASPLLADRMETIAARRISFLASKIPPKPDYAVNSIGPSTWQPSEMAMRTFARYVAAVEDPGGVEERLADGTLSPEDADAYRTVYPERYADMQRQILEELPKLRETLSYPKRLSLSIFSGVPVDPAMTPEMVALLQGQFEAEPGSEGGHQAPQPQPQFGSISRPEPTSAQERAG